MKIYFLTILSSFFVLSIGCAQPINHELKIGIKNSDHLCLFTENSKTYLDETNSFLVFISEIQVQGGYIHIYSREYKNRKFPINEKDCIPIPLSAIKFNTPYSINLETNKNFTTDICVNNTENKIKVEYLVAGKLNCS
ncbi:hypothetical protein I6M90_16295 [Acinetobacter bereziniae]|uniref:NF045616 family extracytoplasmic (lipo)protein n=1 Tax=Acinetobacter bereziniae TaxID=106648 RepID=UPI001901EE6E|nr:NF045616 family extracytoplasmic (lipo)protein [Acinetobacter bereziniae]MBJ8453476.1 hypothetical protein [Acinetobacter bereziniae]MBJ8457618.1 hypothetical protein [Acinetobacter bereziniae]